MARSTLREAVWRTACACIFLAAGTLTTISLTESTAAPRPDADQAGRKQTLPRTTPAPQADSVLLLRRTAAPDAALDRASIQSGSVAPARGDFVETGIRHAFGAPVNDLCENSILITDGVHPFTTVGASTDGSAYNCVDNWSCEALGSGLRDVPTDVWFRYTATCTGTMTATTCEELGGGADYDTKIAIEDGHACPAVPFGTTGTCLDPESGCAFLGCGDDFIELPCGQNGGSVGGDGGSSTVEVAVNVGQEVRIRIGGFDANQSGSGDLLVSCSGEAFCGDTVCAPDETCSCPADCPVPPTETADGNCQDGLDNDCDGDIDCDDGDCGSDTVCSCPASLVCPGGALMEPEVVCSTDYFDVTNSGCNGAPEPPGGPYNTTTINLGDTICGQTGRFDLSCTDNADCMTNDSCWGTCVGGFNAGSDCNPNNGDVDCMDGMDDGTCGNRICRDTQVIPGTRDRDYYLLTLTERTVVTYCVETTFPALVGFSQDNSGAECNGTGVAPFAQPGPCEPVCLEATLDGPGGVTNGVYALYVAPDQPSGPVDCGPTPTPITGYGSSYVISVTGEPAPVETVCTVEGEGDLRRQLPDQDGHGSGNIAIATSEAGLRRIADNFRLTAAADVDNVCWWGTYIDDADSDCGPGPGDDFTITYYENDADGLRPGTEIASFNVSASKVATLEILAIGGVGDVAEYGFSASHPPISLDAECYWIAIQNSVAGGCDWLWTTAGADGLSARDITDCGSYTEVNDYDLAYCLDDSNGFLVLATQPNGCNPSGSCCSGSVCDDDVPFSDCTDGRFSDNETCAGLTLPCGGGACCESDGSCSNTTEGACSGVYSEGQSCSEVICSVADSGCFQNGIADACSEVTGSRSQYAGDEAIESADDFELAGTGPFSIDAIRFDVIVQGGTPDDFQNIVVAVYDDAQSDGDTDVFTVDCEEFAIPQSSISGAQFPCDIPQDCGGQGSGVCVDANNDCSKECCAFCELTVPVGPGDEIIDLDVEAVIAHTWQADINMALEHVGQSTIVNLIRRPGQAIHTDACPTAQFDGYGANNFGDPAGVDPPLTLDDEAEPVINNYCDVEGCPGGQDGGTANYAGPARPGGCNEPTGQLAGFRGQTKSGVWRVYVSDGYGVTDTGTLDSISLVFNDFLGPGPTGKPAYTTVACAGDQDCIDAGGTTCGLLMANVCDDLQVPAGGHSGQVTGDAEALTWTWEAIPGQPDAYTVIIDLAADGLSIDVDANTKHWLAVAPTTAPLSDIETFWMVSDRKNGSRAEQITSGSTSEWASIGPRDLVFEINPAACTPACPGGDALECPTDACTWCACVAGSCECVAKTVQADLGGGNGACPIDNACDGNDNFHALNCFSNSNTTNDGMYPCESTTPTPVANVDAGGSNGSCIRDDTCDGNDAFAALNCFSNSNTTNDGPYPCVCAGPVPQSPPSGQVRRVRPTSGVTLRAPETVRPGELVDVDVYLDGALKALRGYQLHLGVSGGTQRTLELVDISVDADRRDYIFARAPGTWQAFNRSTQQLVVGMNPPEGLPTAAGSYVATFTYRVPRDAAGTFVVSLRYDGDSAIPVDRTFLFGSYAAPIDVSAVTPVRIKVDAPRAREQRLGMR